MARSGYTVPVDIAREYMSKPEFASMPRLKLARIMHAENPIVFSSPEDARSRLRYIAGKKGGRDKKYAGTQFIEEADRPKNPYNLPESDEIVFEPFIFPDHKRIAILSDIHVPYHSVSAITAVLDYYKQSKPDALLLNGDVLDCYQLSRFDRDPRKRRFSEELTLMTDLLTVFRKELDCPIYFKYGNHSERYDHFLHLKAKELVGIEEFELENIIKKRVPDITIIKDKRMIKIGGHDVTDDGEVKRRGALSVLHGHEFSSGFFSPVNIARGLFLRSGISALQSHNHQTSEHSQMDLDRKLVTCWSIGCLCELSPDYAKYNRWNHGFGEVIVNADKSWQVNNMRITKGKVL